MSPYRETVSVGQVIRWALLGLVLVAGLVAFFIFGPQVDPLVRSTP